LKHNVKLRENIFSAVEIIPATNPSNQEKNGQIGEKNAS
jgi:hypothetical protein